MRIGRLWMAAGAVVVLLAAAEGSALASAVPVPEIDGTTLSAGLGLIAGGLLMLRARRRPK